MRSFGWGANLLQPSLVTGQPLVTGQVGRTVEQGVQMRYAEMGPRTGRSPGYLSVGVDSPGGNVAIRLKEADQAGQRTHLCATGAVMHEVAHQTNPDSLIVVVVIRCLAVSAVLLFGPARADFDGPVRGVASISNHEVIAEFVPIELGPTVKFVEACDSADLSGTMVDHDALPPRTDAAGRHPPGLRGDVP